MYIIISYKFFSIIMKFSHLYLKRACEAFAFYGHEAYCLGFIYFCSRRKIAACLICYLLLPHIANVRHPLLIL